MKKDYQKLAEEFIEELQATVQSGVDLQYKQGAYGFAQFLQSQEEKEEPKYQGCSTGACPKVSHSGNCGCKCHREPKEVKLINEFVEAYDFESLAKSYRESEIAWSKNEWEQFIKEIKKQERKNIEEELKHIAMHHVKGHGMYAVADVLEVLNK